MMKEKIVFVGLLYVVCMFAHAQSSQLEYRPFAQEDKTWKTQVGLTKENLFCNHIDGDTLINGETWKKVYNYVGSPDFDYSYYAAIRDVGRKVYAIAKGNSKPRLLYNFDIKVGNVIKCGMEGNTFCCLLDADEKADTLLGFEFVSYLRVERIDTIKARGLMHRRFTLSLLDAYKGHYMNGEDSLIDDVVWIEGIGSGAGPFLPWMPLPARETFFQSCAIGKTCIFGYPDFYNCDATNKIRNTHSFTNDYPQLYNLLGHRQSNKPAKGVYIENGRKRVVK